MENRSEKNQQPMHLQRIKEQVADQSKISKNSSKEVVESKGNSKGDTVEGRDARTLVPFHSDRKSNHVSYNN
jgi:hypothetical protein